ncbi:MAG: hypothetical protein AMXMBFR72_17570 [Betaproteobacteria bacterium]
MRVRGAEPEVQRVVAMRMLVRVVVLMAVHGAVGMDVHVRMAVLIVVRVRRVVMMRMAMHRAVRMHVLVFVRRIAFDLRGVLSLSKGFAGAAAAGRTHGRFLLRRLRVP